MFEIVAERLSVIHMMDEMHGVDGDQVDSAEQTVGQTSPIVERETTLSSPANASVLEEMIQMKETLSRVLSGVPDKITAAESAILNKKRVAGIMDRGSAVFSVSDSADHAEIARWLGRDDFIGLNSTLVSMASHVQIPTTMMEAILRRLHGENYGTLYVAAVRRLAQRRDA